MHKLFLQKRGPISASMHQIHRTDSGIQGDPTDPVLRVAMNQPAEHGCILAYQTRVYT